MIYHISDEIIGLNVEWSIIPKIKWVYSLRGFCGKGNTYIENVFSNFMGTFDYFNGKALFTSLRDSLALQGRVRGGSDVTFDSMIGKFGRRKKKSQEKNFFFMCTIVCQTWFETHFSLRMKNQTIFHEKWIYQMCPIRKYFFFVPLMRK